VARPGSEGRHALLNSCGDPLPEPPPMSGRPRPRPHRVALVAGADAGPADLVVSDAVALERIASLFATEYPRLVRYAYLLTRSNEQAEDVVQESFAKLHDRIGRISDPGPYLQRMVTNACRDVARRAQRDKKRRAHLEVDATTTTDLGADHLRDALAALPHRQRAALVLRFYEDADDTAIARALGVRPATVRSLVHRGLAQLRKEVPR
jgi:RNA polymerase sigma factor (sigma-70 family)